MAKQTSRVPVVWTATYAAIAAATWPAHPVTGFVIEPAYGGDRQKLQEAVIVPGTVAGPAGQQWRTMGDVTKEEIIRIEILMWTLVSGQEPNETKDRIAALEAVAEVALRDQTTGLPTGISQAGVRVWSVASVDFAVGPLGTSEGYGATCRMEVQFTCRL